MGGETEEKVKQHHVWSPYQMEVFLSGPFSVVYQKHHSSSVTPSLKTSGIMDFQSTDPPHHPDSHLPYISLLVQENLGV